MNKRLLRDYSTIYSINEIWDALYKNYKITDYFDDEEYMYFLAEALHYDFVNKRCNYKAFIKPGMSARMLFELRISMILHIFDDKFFDAHDDFTTPEQVSEFRIKHIRDFGLKDYSEHDGFWQLYYFCMMFIDKEKFVDLHLDFEPCFADAKYFDFPSHEDYMECKRMSNTLPYRIYRDEKGTMLYRIDWEAVAKTVFETPAVEYIPKHASEEYKNKLRKQGLGHLVD